MARTKNNRHSVPLTTMVEPEAWPPLASSPACFNALAADLGMNVDRLEFVDVVGIDDESLELLPPLCHALILAYPSPSACETYLRSFPVALDNNGIDANDASSSGNSAVYYHCRQLVGGTCGTIAVIHALANYYCGTHYSPQENTLLCQLMTKANDDDDDDDPSSSSGRLVLDSARLREAHDKCSKATAVKPGIRGRRQGRHFVTFTQQLGSSSLVMLDGRREGPVTIDSGVDATSPGGFLKAAAAHIQNLMAVTATTGDDASLFSLLALVETSTPDEKCSG